MTHNEETPALYLFPATLSDTPATDVLPAINISQIKKIKHFVVENIRTARRFLKKCDTTIDINSLTFTELNIKTDPDLIPSMLEPLTKGESIGVISEAGCPAIADPGAALVAEAQKRKLRVIPLVGPSSILLSLMGSGFNGQSFAFVGYLPIDPAKRAATLKRLHHETVRDRRTQIFIETPYRNNRLINEIITVLPPSALLCVAADLTGPNQRITTMPLSQWKKHPLDYDKTPAIFLLYS